MENKYSSIEELNKINERIKLYLYCVVPLAKNYKTFFDQWQVEKNPSDNVIFMKELLCYLIEIIVKELPFISTIENQEFNFRAKQINFFDQLYKSIMEQLNNNPIISSVYIDPILRKDKNQRMILKRDNNNKIILTYYYISLKSSNLLSILTENYTIPIEQIKNCNVFNGILHIFNYIKINMNYDDFCNQYLSNLQDLIKLRFFNLNKLYEYFKIEDIFVEDKILTDQSSKKNTYIKKIAEAGKNYEKQCKEIDALTGNNVSHVIKIENIVNNLKQIIPIMDQLKYRQEGDKDVEEREYFNIKNNFDEIYKNLLNLYKNYDTIKKELNTWNENLTQKLNKILTYINDINIITDLKTLNCYCQIINQPLNISYQHLHKNPKKEYMQNQHKKLMIFYLNILRYFCEECQSDISLYKKIFLNLKDEHADLKLQKLNISKYSCKECQLDISLYFNKKEFLNLTNENIDLKLQKLKEHNNNILYSKYTFTFKYLDENENTIETIMRIDCNKHDSIDTFIDDLHNQSNTLQDILKLDKQRIQFQIDYNLSIEQFFNKVKMFIEEIEEFNKYEQHARLLNNKIKELNKKKENFTNQDILTENMLHLLPNAIISLKEYDSYQKPTIKCILKLFSYIETIFDELENLEHNRDLKIVTFDTIPMETMNIDHIMLNRYARYSRYFGFYYQEFLKKENDKRLQNLLKEKLIKENKEKLMIQNKSNSDNWSTMIHKSQLSEYKNPYKNPFNIDSILDNSNDEKVLALLARIMQIHKTTRFK